MKNDSGFHFLLRACVIWLFLQQLLSVYNMPIF
jgi:hypothetical protein